MLTFDGMAFLPVVTAAVVGARLTGSLRSKERPLSGHVIVAGLGNVGTRIAGQLHDLGVDVVCVDRDENAAGIRLARQLGLRVVIGETTREETLRAAGIRTSQALVSVTNSDIVNLETALHARALAADVRLVLRLSDDDLAERVQKTVGNAISRSVPYLAAPAFAAAMLEHQVLRTIPVGPARAADRGRQGRSRLRAGRAAGGERAPGRRGTGHRGAARRGRRGGLVTAARLPDRPAGPDLRSGHPHRAERGIGPKPKRRRSRASVSRNLGLPQARIRRYAQGRSSVWFC